jgi:hypothetical protein
MAPSNDEIEQALLDATYQVYKYDPDDTTVNKVRKQTEENLGLEDGFLSSDDWKKKSKELIKQRVVSLTCSQYFTLVHKLTPLLGKTHGWVDTRGKQ